MFKQIKGAICYFSREAPSSISLRQWLHLINYSALDSVVELDISQAKYNIQGSNQDCQKLIAECDHPWALIIAF